MKIYEDRDYLNYLMSVENSKDNPKGGWSEELGKWFPHESRESDGSFTIAYGHKMFADEVEINGEMVDLKNGVTDEQARMLKTQDIVRHTARAERDFNSIQPMGKKVLWKDLPYNAKVMLSEMAFNPGLINNGKWGWPKLTKAIKAGDWDTAIAETERSLEGRKLTRRNEAFKEYLQKKNELGEQFGSRYADISTGDETIDSVLGQEGMGIPAEVSKKLDFRQLLDLSLKMRRQKRRLVQENVMTELDGLVNSAMWMQNKQIEVESARAEQAKAENEKAQADTKPMPQEKQEAPAQPAVSQVPEFFLDESGKVFQMVDGKAEQLA